MDGLSLEEVHIPAGRGCGQLVTGVASAESVTTSVWPTAAETRLTSKS